MLCSKCGTKQGVETVYCSNCGNMMSTSSEHPEKDELSSDSANKQPDLFKQLYNRFTTEHPNSKKRLRMGISNIIIGIINIWLAQNVPSNILGRAPEVIRNGTFTSALTFLGIASIIVSIIYIYDHNQNDGKQPFIAAIALFMVSVFFVVTAAYPLATAGIQNGGWLWIFIFEPLLYISDIYVTAKFKKQAPSPTPPPMHEIEHNELDEADPACEETEYEETECKKHEPTSHEIKTKKHFITAALIIIVIILSITSLFFYEFLNNRGSSDFIEPTPRPLLPTPSPPLSTPAPTLPPPPTYIEPDYGDNPESELYNAPNLGYPPHEPNETDSVYTYTPVEGEYPLPVPRLSPFGRQVATDFLVQFPNLFINGYQPTDTGDDAIYTELVRLSDFDNDGIPEIYILTSYYTHETSSITMYAFIDGSYQIVREVDINENQFYFDNSTGRMVVRIGFSPCRNVDTGVHYFSWSTAGAEFETIIGYCIQAEVFRNFITNELHPELDHDISGIPDLSAFAIPGIPNTPFIKLNPYFMPDDEMFASIHQRIGLFDGSEAEPTPTPTPTPVYTDAATTPIREAAPFYDRGTSSHWVFDEGRSGHPWIDFRDGTSMGGILYDNVLYFRLGYDRTYAASLFTHHNLGGRYTWLTGYAGRVDGTALLDITMDIYGDGELLKSYTHTAGDLPFPVSVLIEGVRLLRIKVSRGEIVGSTGSGWGYDAREHLRAVSFGFTGFLE
jgi:hypothetical protein